MFNGDLVLIGTSLHPALIQGRHSFGTGVYSRKTFVQGNMVIRYTCIMSSFLLALLGTDRQCIIVPQTAGGGVKSDFPVSII